MSQENENKPDDNEFDMNDAAQGAESGNPFAEDTFNPFGEDSAFSDNGLSDGNISETPLETSDGGFEFPSFGNDAFEVSDEASEVPTDGGLEDLSAAPSFALDQDTSSSPEFPETQQTEEIVPPEVEDKKSKKKKKPAIEKKKKEKPVKEPMEIGAVLSLVFAILLLIGLIAVNVYIAMVQPYKDLGVGMASTIYYLVFVDVFGLCGVAPFFLFYVYHKGLDFFKVMLGVSVTTMSIGVILLLTAFYRYDFTIKATSFAPPTPAATATNYELRTVSAESPKRFLTGAAPIV